MHGDKYIVLLLNKRPAASIPPLRAIARHPGASLTRGWSMIPVAITRARRTDMLWWDLGDVQVWPHSFTETRQRPAHSNSRGPHRHTNRPGRGLPLPLACPRSSLLVSLSANVLSSQSTCRGPRITGVYSHSVLPGAPPSPTGPPTPAHSACPLCSAPRPRGRARGPSPCARRRPGP